VSRTQIDHASDDRGGKLFQLATQVNITHGNPKTKPGSAKFPDDFIATWDSDAAARDLRGD